MWFRESYKLIKIQICDGRTISVDLNSDLSIVKKQLTNPRFQKNITALQIYSKGNVWAVLKKPKKYKDIKWGFGKIGEAKLDLSSINNVKSKDIGEVVYYLSGGIKHSVKWFYSNNMILSEIK